MIAIRPAGRSDIPALIAIDPLSLTDVDRRQSIARWAAAGQQLGSASWPCVPKSWSATWR